MDEIKNEYLIENIGDIKVMVAKYKNIDDKMYMWLDKGIVPLFAKNNQWMIISSPIADGMSYKYRIAPLKTNSITPEPGDVFLNLDLDIITRYKQNGYVWG